MSAPAKPPKLSVRRVPCIGAAAAAAAPDAASAARPRGLAAVPLTAPEAGQIAYVDQSAGEGDSTDRSLRHMPPPPPNQIILVDAPEGVQMSALYEPFWLEGEVSTVITDNGMAKSAYTMQLDKLSPYGE